MNQQLQQLQVFKKKYENISSTVLELTNPFLFFIKIEPNMDNKKYIYWFAYCMGKVNSILWGVYKNKKKEFSIRGICKITKDVLSESTKLKMKQGFVLAAEMSKNNITSSFKKYLDKKTHEILFQNSPVNFMRFFLHENRDQKPDLFTPFSQEEETFLYRISKQFLHYIERNLVLFEKAEVLCVELEKCPEQYTEFENFACNAYYYGMPKHRFKKSQEDDQDDEDDQDNLHDDFVNDLT
jgi:hypothetical protein